MIMRKNENYAKKEAFSFTKFTKILFLAGIFPIALALFCLVIEVTAPPSFPLGTARYYGKMLEHILAALALLTAGCYLTQRATQAK